MGVDSPAPSVTVPVVSCSKLESLRTRGQFGAVLRAGRRERRTLVALAARPNDLERLRVGYAVGKRVGGAVVRNRVRRRLRELMRRYAGVLEGGGSGAGGWDLVVTAQPAASDASFAELASDVASALEAMARVRPGGTARHDVVRSLSGTS